MRMRLRTEPAAAATAAPRPSGGRRFLPKLWTGHRSPQANGGYSPAAVDHPTPLRGEEPPPQREIFTFAQRLDSQHFSEASQLLLEREARLFGTGAEAEAEPLRHHEEEAAWLADDYRELESRVWKTLNLSLSASASRAALASAVRAVHKEAEQDGRWQQSPQGRPSWRPGNWRKLHDETLRNLVQQRLDEAAQQPLGLHAELTAVVRRLKEDLLLVVEQVGPCYPPEADVCTFYAGLYHRCLGARLKEKAELELTDDDCKTVLLWANGYYPDILKKPQLASNIDVESLGQLLPKNSQECLEKKFLSKMKDELRTCIARVVDEENEKWLKGEEPSTEDGCYVSHEAFDIIQCVDGMVRTVEKVVGERHKAHDVTAQINDFMQMRKTFQSDIMKQNKANSRPFVKANLHFIEQFSCVLHKQSSLFSKDVHAHLEQILPDMRQSAHSYLLKPVHEALKRHYRKLGTSEWLNQPLFDELLDCITQEFQEVQGSSESCHEKLVCQMHQEVAVEYVKRLLKGGIKLKDQSLQLKAYNNVKDDAESLHHLFSKMGSQEGWLKDVLMDIAEVLKLQDLSSIQLHVALLGKAFPDFSVKHVSALLKLKTNLSKKDRNNIKETLSETLAEGGAADATPFFSKVQLK